MKFLIEADGLLTALDRSYVLLGSQVDPCPRLPPPSVTQNFNRRTP